MTDSPASPKRNALAPTTAPESAASQTDAAATDVHESDVDAQAHDLAEYDWIPVRRKPRKDGWTIDAQRRFIETLADSGSVTLAACEAGMSTMSCYRLRRSPDAKPFATAWDIALQAASRRLADIAFDRAINGSEEPVFDPDGNRIGVRRRYNDRLLMFLMRTHQPERYRHGDRESRLPSEMLPPPLPGVAAALAALAPPIPADPRLLNAPDELESRLEAADIGEGELPRWYRGPEPLAPPEPSKGPVRSNKRQRADGDDGD